MLAQIVSRVGTFIAKGLSRGKFDDIFKKHEEFKMQHRCRSRTGLGVNDKHQDHVESARPRASSRFYWRSPIILAAQIFAFTLALGLIYIRKAVSHPLGSSSSDTASSGEPMGPEAVPLVGWQAPLCLPSIPLTREKMVLEPL